MNITHLNIEGFRSRRSLTWSPTNLNIIIGPNSTGKSNLLRCLELISIAAQGKLRRHIQSRDGMEPMVWNSQAKSITIGA